jgi:hypothetical protein
MFPGSLVCHSSLLCSLGFSSPCLSDTSRSMLSSERLPFLIRTIHYPLPRCQYMRDAHLGYLLIDKHEIVKVVVTARRGVNLCFESVRHCPYGHFLPYFEICRVAPPRAIKAGFFANVACCPAFLLTIIRARFREWKTTRQG